MADPFSLSVSVVFVEQLTATVAQHLHDIEGASTQRRRLSSEVSCVSGTFLKNWHQSLSLEAASSTWRDLHMSIREERDRVDRGNDSTTGEPLQPSTTERSKLLESIDQSRYRASRY